MIKKGIAPILLMLVMFSSCSGKFNGFQINGEIKGLENQEVYLEFLTPTAVEQIDTVKTDASGKFTMKGNLKEKGFYRLVSDDKFWILLLENTKVKFVADANDAELKDVKISGYKEGEAFQEAIDFLIVKQEEYSAESQKMQSMVMGQEISIEQRMEMEASFGEFQKKIMDELKAKIDVYADKSPFASVYLLSALNPQDDTEYISKTVNILDPKIPNSVYLSNIKEILQKIDEQMKQQAMMEAQAEKIVENTSAPDIVMNNPEGKQVKLSDLRGKIVLVDFWAAWCKPCRAENPNVVRMYQLYKNKGFDIFSVSLDKTQEAWVEAIAKDGLIWKSHVSDLKFWDSAAAKEWGVTSIPATFLLDREGNIIAKNLRGAALEAKLKEIL